MSPPPLSIRFCGAAGTVTGSNYLVRHPGARFLVDCGLFQGSKTIRELNYGAFPFDPASIDFVLLTHAHIDHAGLVPKLIRQGFEGPVYATAGTRDLLSFMLPDSGYIQEREVEHLNRRNRRRGRDPVTPIYTQADGEAALEQFRTVDYESWFEPADGVRVRMWNAGHILGAASLEIELGGEATRRILFSGDIGPDIKMFHPDPDAPSGWDYVVCESTYGDRIRPIIDAETRRRNLAQEVNAAFKRGGVLVIPAFAVERTQELIIDLLLLMRDGTIPTVPLFLDSPLAIRATGVFGEHAHQLEDLPSGNPFENPNIHFTETVEESKAIHRYTSGVIVMAASGMCDAGRIRHHLKEYLPSSASTVLLVGYQAPATLGSLLAAGREAVRIMGEEIKVRARIVQFDAYSGHADRDGLINWMTERLPVHRSIFLTHGEADAIAAFKEALVQSGISARRIRIPRLDDEVDLITGKSMEAADRREPRIDVKQLGQMDWHNDLAQLSLDLRAALDAAADEKSRKVILRRIRRALGQGRRH